MRRWGIWLCVGLLALVLSASAGAADRSKLNVYTAEVSAAKAAELVRAGYDIADTRVTARGVRIELVLSASERRGLTAEGVDLELKRDKKGRTIAQRAALQALNGFTVWRSNDEPGGFRDQAYALARRNPGIFKLVVLGRSHEGREIIALKMTAGARGLADGKRPGALYISGQHAREWIGGEVNIRFLRWLVGRWKAGDPAIKSLLETTELWFVLVANPDGYQYTFDSERLWRKNLRDNNGDGQITNGDGVDPNRNFPEHWKYDNEGSSSQTSSETYRGPSAGSEPETQALMSLARRANLKFVVNWHSVGSWILYAPGWQMETTAADTPIYVALAGTDTNSAIPGYDPDNGGPEPRTPDFDPGPSANELYVTNGETTDWFATNEGSLGFTPEMSDGGSGGGFVFPDSESLVQKEADAARPFALDVAKSVRNPANPVSHLGIATAPFYLNLTGIDPEMTRSDKGNFAFQWSYGDPQTVRILAKRSLGAVSLKYQINGGAVQTRSTSEWEGGEVYGQEGSLYYHVVEGVVSGTSPGDNVRVWFEGGGATSDSFTYQAVSETGNDVLVMAAEDYSGASNNPAYPAGPRPFFLSSYANALSANGIAFDLYDVDARNRTAPDALGVLSHYKAVIWYTGNDLVTREPGWGAGNASRLANDEIIEVRAFMNEGGRVLYTGKFAGHQGTTAHGTQFYDPIANEQCRANPAILARCEPLHGVGDLTNDFLQYWLGTYILNDNAGNGNPACNPATFANCNVVDVEGVDTPFTSLIWGFNGADSAGNQNHSASFLTTRGILGPEFPHFNSWVAGKYIREGGPFEPHDGTKYMYSQMADVSYKRITRTIDLTSLAPGAPAELRYWISFDTEHDWDFVMTEAHTLDASPDDDWTTLRDLNGHNSQDLGPSTPPGEDDAASCPAGWNELHPHIDHYQTNNGDGTCSPTGSTGAWWAASGNSAGWQEWRHDLSAYSGKQVEISIAYVSDWAVQGLGAFVDHVTVSTGAGTTSFEDDADPMDGWAVTGPPPGSGPNANNFIRTDAQGFPEGAVVATPDSIYMGFGFEGITGAATRTMVMDRAMDYLLR